MNLPAAAPGGGPAHRQREHHRAGAGLCYAYVVGADGDLTPFYRDFVADDDDDSVDAFDAAALMALAGALPDARLRAALHLPPPGEEKVVTVQVGQHPAERWPVRVNRWGVLEAEAEYPSAAAWKAFAAEALKAFAALQQKRARRGS